VVDTPKTKPASRPRHPVAEKIVLESESSHDPFARQEDEFLATAAEA